MSSQKPNDRFGRRAKKAPVKSQFRLRESEHAVMKRAQSQLELHTMTEALRLALRLLQITLDAAERGWDLVLVDHQKVIHHLVIPGLTSLPRTEDGDYLHEEVEEAHDQERLEAEVSQEHHVQERGGHHAT